MIDVFLCSFKPDARREDMLRLCARRWFDEPCANVHELMGEMIGSTGRAFQRERRMYADSHAISDPYVVADDDCLPQAGPFIEDCARILRLHPDFAVLSLWPYNFPISRWSPQGYAMFEDADVTEHVSVGGIRFCRKGALREWPWAMRVGYDTEHGEALRALGRRSGYFLNYRMTHLGEGYSSLAQKHDEVLVCPV